VTTTTKLTEGAHIGWFNSGAMNSCNMCGRKLGKNPYFVHLSIDGTLLPIGAEDSESQGYWEIGSECAKKIEPNLLSKKAGA